MDHPGLYIKIPEEREDAFEKFINLSNDEIAQFLKALREAQPSMTVDGFTEKLSELTKTPYEYFEDIIIMFFELYAFHSTKDNSMEEVVSSLCHYARESKNPKLIPNDSDWDKLKDNLLAVLNQENALTISAKAIEIYSDFQKLFCNSKIYSDIRPVFTSNFKEKPKMIVLHNLKITYYENNKHKEIFIMLDSDDLKQLKNQIQRAEKKEDSLEEILKNSGFHLF